MAKLFSVENHGLTSNPALTASKALPLQIFFLLLHPASEEGVLVKGWLWAMDGRIYFKINIAEAEKIATFAALSGRRES
ncbi:hypothetical protein [Pedobacter sp. KLB.chiD]|uniref:hypothetical protein n=1 Tax=Pedobacter sp. KLB.chiD TaxID=3387402 RepID=UPI00399C0465